MMDRKAKMKTAGLVLVILLTIAGGLRVGSFLPVIGAHETPANIYLSNYYIENAIQHTHAANIVTAVLADYRGFDTLFETCVLFLSGVGTLMVLFSKAKVKRRLPKPRKTESHSETGEMFSEFTQRGSYSSGILDASFRIIMPIVMIYAIYVLFHGELSLGGGFQAGAPFSMHSREFFPCFSAETSWNMRNCRLAPWYMAAWQDCMQLVF